MKIKLKRANALMIARIDMVAACMLDNDTLF
jgi:hypothetical protein